MVLGVQVFEPLARHMGVDGGGGDVGVAQQQLHRAQIGAVVEQVGGKGVAQGVGRQRAADASGQRVFFHQGPEHHAGHAGAARGDEQRVAELALQDGTASLDIDLASVNTGVDIRNERMREIFFAVAENPKATVTAALDPAGFAGLAVGQSVKVIATTRQTHKGAAVPQAAVVRGGGGDQAVWVHTTAEKFERRTVRAQALSADSTALISGIAAGERVVTQGASLLAQVR